MLNIELAGSTQEIGTSELQLIELAVKGDFHATKTLYDNYIHRVYQLVFYNTGNNHDLAEDITQEVFLSVFSSLDKYSGKSRLYTWIYRIALNKIADYHRNNHSENKYGYTVQDLDMENLDVPSSEDVEKEYETRETTHNLFKNLKPEYRQVLYLKYIEKFSLNDISAIMQRTPKSIEGLLDRAKTCMKQQHALIEGNNSDKIGL